MGVYSIEVKIRTPSRLHFGIIDMRGDLGRIHGSVGVAIENPYLSLKASESNELVVNGPRASRIREYVNIILDEYCIQEKVRIEVFSDIPEHMGFGSGTQLALSIGKAISCLFKPEIRIKEIAKRLERSRVSGIGTYSFLNGGFIVDGGHRISSPNKVPPLVFRSDFPDDWYFVVGVPKIERGPSGDNEKNAFKKLEPPPANLVAEVSRIVLIQMIPSILEHEIEPFGEAMTKLDAMFGDYWALVQGGRYTHQRIEDSVNHLLNNGAYGAGQSSWGPALYGLAEGKKQAEELADSLNNFLNEGKEKGKTFVTDANNTGAQVRVME
jgi:beta-RFAP synthase